MRKPTCPRPDASGRDAASVVFNLPGYEVIEALDRPLGGRRVRVQASERADGCPDCGVVSARVHAWHEQRVTDIPAGGAPVEVTVRKPRLVCAEYRCQRRTFTQATDQLPKRARCFTRLGEQLVDAVIESGRTVEEVADSHGVAWWTVQRRVTAEALSLPDPDEVPVRALGVDEHRFARPRWVRDEQGAWRRVEPWMSTFVDAQTGRLLGVVDGRGAGGIREWLEARSPGWRVRVETVAIDLSSPFYTAITTALPHAQVSVDHWHLVRLANQMITTVRQRVAREQLGRRGRADDPAWAHRMLLLRAGDRLSTRALARLDHVFCHDDPTRELAAAWAVKERLRQLLASHDLAAADHARGLLGIAVAEADTPETWRLWDTVNAWWHQIEVFLLTRVTNARTEARNTSIKQTKRTGRGYRNTAHYRARILLASHRRTRRHTPLNQPATTFNCG